MIKGVNRQIIEVTQTENMYFERALLVIKPEYTNVGANQLDFEAEKYLRNLKPPYSLRSNHSLTYWLVRLVPAAMLGSILTLAVVQTGII